MESKPHINSNPINIKGQFGRVILWDVLVELLVVAPPFDGVQLVASSLDVTALQLRILTRQLQGWYEDVRDDDRTCEKEEWQALKCELSKMKLQLKWVMLICGVAGRLTVRNGTNV